MLFLENESIFMKEIKVENEKIECWRQMFVFVASRGRLGQSSNVGNTSFGHQCYAPFYEQTQKDEQYADGPSSKWENDSNVRRQVLIPEIVFPNTVEGRNHETISNQEENTWKSAVHNKSFSYLSTNCCPRSF